MKDRPSGHVDAIGEFTFESSATDSQRERKKEEIDIVVTFARQFVANCRTTTPPLFSQSAPHPEQAPKLKAGRRTATHQATASAISAAESNYPITAGILLHQAAASGTTNRVSSLPTSNRAHVRLTEDRKYVLTIELGCTDSRLPPTELLPFWAPSIVAARPHPALRPPRQDRQQPATSNQQPAQRPDRRAASVHLQPVAFSSQGHL
ncbi:hypothetical protein Landi51_11692 [Colletotrichum acutatum]